MLTDAAIRDAKSKDKPYKLPKEQGLFVIVNPNGSKWWRYSYRLGGKDQTLSFGTYPLIPLSLARQRRDEARGQLAQGINPSVQRKQVREAQAEAAVVHLFKAVAERWNNEEMSSNSDEYRATVMRLLERDVFPYIGKDPIVGIKTPALIKVFDRIRQRGVEDTARRARTVVGQIFRFAIRRGLAEHDPTQALKGERRLKPIKHFAAFTEPADVARLMVSIYGYKGSPAVRAALKISALLWQRPGEIRMMQWTQLDFHAAEWRYVVNKSKRRTGSTHIVPLPKQAIEILQELFPLTGEGLGLRPDAPRFVFPTPKTKLRPLSENAVRQALRNLGYTNEEMTAHGFRAMARSLLAEQGWKPDAIERQLSHRASGPLGAAYDRAAFLGERKQMMQAWADYLDRLRDPASTCGPARGRKDLNRSVLTEAALFPQPARPVKASATLSPDGTAPSVSSQPSTSMAERFRETVKTFRNNTCVENPAVSARPIGHSETYASSSPSSEPTLAQAIRPTKSFAERVRETTANFERWPGPGA